ncbi:MAG: hypothetical protein K2I95_09305, partial [Treponemataceae bacterium]|nr:hypothetical protein [Treponemataceae bacterium]
MENPSPHYTTISGKIQHRREIPKPRRALSSWHAFPRKLKNSGKKKYQQRNKKFIGSKRFAAQAQHETVSIL